MIALSASAPSWLQVWLHEWGYVLSAYALSFATCAFLCVTTFRALKRAERKFRRLTNQTTGERV